MAKFIKGKSGNPSGRPKGIKDRRAALRSLLEPHAESMVKQLVERALDGDMTALKLALERLLPAYKPTDTPVAMLAFQGKLPERGEKAIAAMSKGLISPGDAKQLIEVLTAQARLVEFAEVEERLSTLEKQYARSNKT